MTTSATSAVPDAGPASMLALDGVAKRYHRGAEVVHALEDVTLELGVGELLALVGPSGSGKTTLLNLVCGWEAPDEGTVRWAEQITEQAEGRTRSETASGRVAHRWADLTIVPQALGLVEELTVRENVALPLRFASGHAALDIDEVLDRFGLTPLAGRPATGTSLGEQQRTAVARALVTRPRLVVADEPTAHQNATWARTLLGELRTVCDDGGSVLVATHDRELLALVDRIARLEDGRLR